MWGHPFCVSLHFGIFLPIYCSASSTALHPLCPLHNRMLFPGWFLFSPCTAVSLRVSSGGSQLVMELASVLSLRTGFSPISACFALSTDAFKQLLFYICLEFMTVIYRTFSLIQAKPPWIETEPPHKLISNIHWLPVLCYVLCRFTYINIDRLNNITR